MKFRVGQIVKLIDNAGMNASINAEAVVTALGSKYLSVKWIKGHTKVSTSGTKYAQMNGAYYYENFVPALEIGKQLEFDFMKV